LTCLFYTGLLHVEGLDLIKHKHYRKALPLILEELAIKEKEANNNVTTVNELSSQRERAPEIVKVVDVQKRTEDNVKKIIVGIIFSILEIGIFTLMYYVGLRSPLGPWFGMVAIVWIIIWISVLNFLFIADAQKSVIVRTEKLQVKLKDGYRWALSGVTYKAKPLPVEA